MSYRWNSGMGNGAIVPAIPVSPTPTTTPCTAASIGTLKALLATGPPNLTLTQAMAMDPNIAIAPGDMACFQAGLAPASSFATVLTGTAIAGIPNWALIGAGVAALFLFGGKR